MILYDKEQDLSIAEALDSIAKKPEIILSWQAQKTSIDINRLSSFIPMSSF